MLINRSMKASTVKSGVAAKYQKYDITVSNGIGTTRISSFKVGQLLLWKMKVYFHFTITSNTASREVPLCSVYQNPSNKPYLSLLTQVSTKLAYLCMLFILEQTCPACNAGQLRTK